MTVVVYDHAAWAKQFPALAQTVDETVGQAYFSLAQTVCDNTDASPIPNDPPVNKRQTCLYLLVAHFATLFGAGDNNGRDATAVGRIESATEGSVTVNFGKYADQISDTEAWYIQTQYGALYWTLTGINRMARYIRAPGRAYAPAVPFGRRRGPY